MVAREEIYQQLNSLLNALPADAKDRAVASIQELIEAGFSDMEAGLIIILANIEERLQVRKASLEAAVNFYGKELGWKVMI